MARGFSRYLALAFAAIALGGQKTLTANDRSDFFGSTVIGGSRSLAGGNPYFFTRRHTKQTYRSQQRLAKKRKKVKQLN